MYLSVTDISLSHGFYDAYVETVVRLDILYTGIGSSDIYLNLNMSFKVD